MKKILIIEDNLELCENLEEILQLAGYEVSTASNGVEGVNAVRKVLPDLILCDVLMPELDGFGVLKILNRDPELALIPFIFLTAKTEKDDLRKGMGLGADDYITKPFDDVELLEAIEMRLKKSSFIKSRANDAGEIHHFYNESKAQKAIEELVENRENRIYNNKSAIYWEGHYPQYMYYVLEGTAKCYATADNGKELITGIYKSGDFIGTSALISNEPYRDTVEALEDTTLALIPIDDLMLKLYNNRDFGTKLVHILLAQARKKDDQLMEVAFSSVRRKVSKALANYMVSMDTNICTLSRDDLASLAGTARETLIRTISDFKSEGLIQIEQGAIVVEDIDKLIKMPQ